MRRLRQGWTRVPGPARLVIAVLAIVAVAGRLAATLPAGAWRLGATNSLQVLAGAIAVAMAVYAAKRLGKNTAVGYEPALYDAVNAEGNRADEVRAAIERDEFVLYYQPVVDLRSARIAGAEALIRWDHPTLGVLPPSEFLGTAARLGLMPQISAWALAEGCGWASRQPPHGDDPPLFVAVNIAASDLDGTDLAGAVEGALRSTGLDPRRLCLEVTESGILADLTAAVTQLTALRALGVTVAIDDFGTGYSSLSQLKHLPVDLVKIDRSFIDGLGTEMDDSAVAAATIGMGHALSLGMVAEGVETDVQLSQLVKLGCESAQGYLFGRPAPADAVLPHAHVAKLIQPLITAEVAEPSQPVLSVLIADDLEGDRRLLRRLLVRSHAFDVVGEASDGARAAELALTLHPDLVLLDLNMPVLGGLGALALIHADSPDAKVVVLSGHMSAEVEQAVLDAGAIGCLRKGPADIVPELLAVLGR